MKLKSIVKLSLLSLGAIYALSSQAAQFIVPPHYNVEVVDGYKDDLPIKGRTIDLDAGRHQIVLLFKDVFGGAQNGQMVQAADPIVIDINNMQQDDVYTFKYELPRTRAMAETFSRNQKIDLVTADGQKLGADKASYFILTSDAPLAFMRDYRQDLMAVNKLYNKDNIEYNGVNSVNSQGVQSVNVSTLNSNLLTTSNYEVNSSSGLTYYGQAPAQTSGANVKLNELINLYNKADDKTKLEFVKYVMSH